MPPELSRFDLSCAGVVTEQQALAAAAADLGYEESPTGSNRTKFGAAFGLNGVPWCVEAIYEWTQGALPKKTAGVYDLMGAFKGKGQLMSHPQVGAIGFWAYGDGHATLVESYIGTSVTDISGNTSSSDGTSNNGGEVARHTRNLATAPLLGFAMPYYSTSPPPLGDHTSIGPSQTLGDDMTRTPIHIAPLDGQGNGYVTTGIPFEKVVSVLMDGPAPQRDTYGWPNVYNSVNNTNGQCEVEVEGGTPGGSVDIVVWSVS